MIVGHIAARRMGRGAYFEFQKLLEIHVASGDDKAPLLHDIGTPLKKSLYETAFKKQVNRFERDVALYLDDNDAVKSWWRIAARKDWGLQGWMQGLSRFPGSSRHRTRGGAPACTGDKGQAS